MLRLIAIFAATIQVTAAALSPERAALRAVAKAASSAAAHSNLASWLTSEGRFAAAAKGFRAAARLAPATPGHHANHAWAMFMQPSSRSADGADRGAQRRRDARAAAAYARAIALLPAGAGAPEAALVARVNFLYERGRILADRLARVAEARVDTTTHSSSAFACSNLRSLT